MKEYGVFENFVSFDVICERVKGAFYGLAIGDALGCTSEFMKKEEVEVRYGTLQDIVGGGILKWEKGDITDDTEMMLAVAEAFVNTTNKMKVDELLNEVAKNFLSWYETQPKDVGMCIDSVLSNTLETVKKNPYLSVSDVMFSMSRAYSNEGRSPEGNGALMRTLPIGLFTRSPYLINELARKISFLTHWSDISAAACVLYTRVIADYCITNEHDFIDKELDSSSHIIFGTFSGLPTGHVVQTMKYLTEANKRFDNIEDALIWIVNLGEDADTTAAVVGGLFGVKNGFSEIPSRWVSKLKPSVVERLDNIVESACEFIRVRDFS